MNDQDQVLRHFHFRIVRLFNSLLVLCLVIPSTIWATPQFDDRDIEFFESQIRPLLEQECGECHGASAEFQEGGFSITSRRSFVDGGDTGPAVVPGKPLESLMIDAIHYRGYYEMPPRSKMSADKIRILEEWVKRGLPWPDHDDQQDVLKDAFDLDQRREDHWCWQSPKALGAPPEVQQAHWPRDTLDRFVLARLEDAGLQPTEDADKATWIRRVCFDLIGLPPRPEDIHAYVSDADESAREKVVDRLLASNHFGERWARHWMDLVRYAETYGHEFDYPIQHAYRYRDYLIRAFNQDVPYDEFVVEHIAGDLMDQRRSADDVFDESILGTGFWFLGEATHGPVDVKADETGRIDNQIDVMCKSFLGITVACARCHDHKFDAISTEDYYALAGYLQSSRRELTILDPYRERENLAKTMRAKWVEEANPVVQRLRQNVEKTPPATWIEDLVLNHVDSSILAVNKRVPGSYRNYPSRIAPWFDMLNRDEDGFRERYEELRNQHARQTESWNAFAAQSHVFEDFSDGIPPNWFVTGWAFDRGQAATAFSLVGDPVMPRSLVNSGTHGGSFCGVLRSPTFELTHDDIFVRARGHQTQIRLVIDGYEMDIHNALLFNGCRFDLTKKDEFVWANLQADVKNYRGHQAYLEFIDRRHGFCQVEEIRFANRDGASPVDPPLELARRVVADDPHNVRDAKASVAQSLLAIQRGASGGRASEVAAVLSALAIAVDHNDDLGKLKEGLTPYGKDVAKPGFALVITDGTGENEHLFIRGNSKTLGPKVRRRFLTALRSGDASKTPIHGSGRLELARHIADADNPLTGRVMVNRIWHHLLGRGIVASVDNFGVLGKEPTHPLLLDYLAREFVDDGWSIKRIIRRIVLSRTYAMSSSINPEGAARDPNNELLHRAHVKRLEGEVIRDAILQATGSLDKKMYGPSVPIHLTEFMQGRGRPRGTGPLDGSGRRSIYVEVRRNFLSPLMLAFDTPIPFATIGNRHQSNVPAQALIMLNDPFVQEQAEKWAERLCRADATTAQRISTIYGEALGRKPSEKEMKAMAAFLGQQARLRGMDTEAISEDQKLWQDLCHVVFNMKEFIFIK